MGTTALRQLLKSFCKNLPWNYAVLWKLRHEGCQTVLSWEDGYCDHFKPRRHLEIISEENYLKGIIELFSSYCETSASGCGSEGYSLGLLVANMANLQYVLGEGIVGQVATTGNHFWVSYGNVSTGKLNAKLVPECPDEWLLQLASGIKTILLVPVLPHGVMQLGSLEVLAEDLAVVAYIKNRFTIHNTGGNTVLSILNRDIHAQSSSTLTSGLMDSIDELSASIISPLKSENSDTIDSVKPNKSLLSMLDPVVPLPTLQDAFKVSGKDMSGTSRSESENKIGVQLGPSEISKSSSHPINAGKLEMMEMELFGLSCMEEGLQAYSQCNNYNMEVLGDLVGRATASYFAGDPVEETFQDEISNNTGNRISASSLYFPKDSELHKALGLAFQRHTSEYLWDSSFSVDNSRNSSSLICSRDLTGGIESTSSTKGTTSSLICSRDLTCGIESTSSAKGDDAEYLLEAVVDNVCRGADDTSDICNSSKSSLTSLGKFVTTSKPQSQSGTSALAGDASIPCSNVKSTCLSRGSDEFTPTQDSFWGTMTAFVDNKQLEKKYNSTQPRKGLKLSNVNRRRAKPGDSQRPRPRDRQLIQDRIKELRELVPNGLKCSIDGLLGQTIEHMLHLRSVTDQAEKLQQWLHQKVATCKDLRSSETNDSNQNGTTRAFEFGNDLLVCPIVVEDLAYPGHMLIEMLCNEHGLFLEVAQVIRSLDLTILKGVMENRSDNTWAHFIVEASIGFHRMKIFWPLVHLLQCKRNAISSKI